jgi:hypothetical protein
MHIALGVRAGLWGALLLLSACTGTIAGGEPGYRGLDGAEAGVAGQGAAVDAGVAGSPGDGAGDPAGGDEVDATGLEACDERSLPGQPLRRLSSTQYHNTLRSLFGPELGPEAIEGSLFPVTQISAGFLGDAEANVVNTSESNAIEDDAERIATLVLDDPDRFLAELLPCGVSGATDDDGIDGCVDDFVERFGRRAYRRPLTESEALIARELYDELRAEQSAVEAWSAVVQYFVQAPALLYRVERGNGTASNGLVRLDDYEMASRLSYFFLDSMPDDALLAAAEAGELRTPGQVAEHARRLIDDPRFRAAFDGFHRDWLRAYELEQSGKDTDTFPDYTPEVQASLLAEASELVAYVMQEGDGSVASLLGSREQPVDATLAEFYGVSAPGADGDTWVPVAMEQRRGLLTLGSFMATLAETDRTNAIHRGAFFQREILCNQLPAFPANLDTQTPLEDTSMLPTARERLSPLLENASCMGCHAQFNPTGLALESYDAVGRYREQENGVAIDSSATLLLDGQMQSFADGREMIEAVAASDDARECYTLQLYRAALGRREFAADACSLALANRAAAEHGGDLRELLVAITQTDGFLYRQPLDDAGEP